MRFFAESERRGNPEKRVQTETEEAYVRFETTPIDKIPTSLLPPLLALLGVLTASVAGPAQSSGSCWGLARSFSLETRSRTAVTPLRRPDALSTIRLRIPGNQRAHHSKPHAGRRHSLATAKCSPSAATMRSYTRLRRLLKTRSDGSFASGHATSVVP
jgi:hypothetical protein